MAILIRRPVAAPQPAVRQPAPTPQPVIRPPAQRERRRQMCARSVVKTWEVSKYRQTFIMDEGKQITVFNPDGPLDEFLVEFKPGLRLIIKEEVLTEYTKEV